MSGPPNISGQQIGPAVETVQVYTPIVGTFDASGNVIQLYGPGGTPLNIQGLTNPMTSVGDMIQGGTAGAEQRLAIGSTGNVLTVSGGAPTWATPAFVNPMTTAGDIIDATTGGAPQRLAVGSNGQVLTVVTGAPAWQTPAASFANPMTTPGDLIDGGTAGAAQRLAIGSTGNVLTVVGGLPVWQTPAFVNPMTTADDLIVGGASGAPTRLAIGSTGNVLTVSGGAPVWQAPAFVNPMTTAGDVITGGSAGAAQRLAVGSNNQVLTVVAGAPAWAATANPAGPPVNAQTGTTYTLALTDAPASSANQGIVTMNNGSANTLTIPANASVAFPVGTCIGVIQLGAGQTTIAITSDTLLNPSSVTARAQNSSLVLQKVATTTWVLGGDMT